MEGCVVDVSKSGVGLRLSHRLSLGEWVKLEMTTAILFGEVRHCTEDGDGLELYVEIETAISRRNSEQSRDDDWISYERTLQ